MGNISLVGATSGGTTLVPQATGTYTVTLPASSDTLATVSNPTFTGTVTATTVTSPSATALTIQSAGTTAMTVDTSQNVGIGTSSPAYKLDVPATVQFQGINIGANGTDIKSTTYGPITLQAQASGAGTNSFAAIYTSGSERMRIDSSGNLLVGTTSVNYVGSGLTVSTNAGSTKWLVGPYAGAATNFLISAASTFGVYLSGTSATSWSSLSDERTKDIIEPINDAVAKVTSLRAIIGSYKNDETKKRRAFLIAQDVQKVLPEAVDSENPDNLGLAYTDVIPLLVAAIQELSAKNDALEARLAALEAK